MVKFVIIALILLIAISVIIFYNYSTQVACMDGINKVSFVQKNLLINISFLKGLYNFTGEFMGVDDVTKLVSTNNIGSFVKNSDVIAEVRTNSCINPPMDEYLINLDGSLKKVNKKANFEDFLQKYNVSCGGCLIPLTFSCC